MIHTVNGIGQVVQSLANLSISTWVPLEYAGRSCMHSVQVIVIKCQLNHLVLKECIIIFGKSVVVVEVVWARVELAESSECICDICRKS